MNENRGPTLLDSPRERRIRKTEKINGMQIMPRLAKVNYWCMLVLSLLAVILEVMLHIRYSREQGALVLANRAAVSAWMCWTFFAVILTAASLLQLRRLKHGHIETKYVERPLGDDTDPFVPVVDPGPKYVRYIRTAVIGEAALLLLCGLLLLIR
ncbi:MAG: hypothetical protein J6P58_03665 [Oscillospiraceae bacterium]|nr:hypothetical protein [Oscillospiraceae bacterium]MBO6040284.1 hypothetical protein [Oscillospiraceae bacterium]